VINYNCPKCQAPLTADDHQVGTIGSCPSCQSQVQVPAKKSNLPLILGIVGGLLIISCGMCIVVGLLGIQVLGTSANSTFGTVGASIGSTLPPPPRK
jgi:DNA-directed RNA polymerase subunit RPC12/RpoP